LQSTVIDGLQMKQQHSLARTLLLFKPISPARKVPECFSAQRGNTLAETTLEDWQRVLQVNLTSVFQLSQLVARDIFARKPSVCLSSSAGKIVNIASLLSFQGGIRVPAYASSKGGVAQLTKALANEWAPKGIQVNAIAPGYFATSNTEALRSDETRNRQILERIPAGRWGQPQDLEGAALFLSSPASDYVTGTVLTVDGGWMAR